MEKSIHDMNQNVESILQLLQTHINPQVPNGASFTVVPKCLKSESVKSESLIGSVFPLSHPSPLPLQAKQIPQVSLSAISTHETQSTSTQSSQLKTNSPPSPLHITPSLPEQATINAAQLEANLVQSTSSLDLPASSVAGGGRKLVLGDVASSADQSQSTSTLSTQLKTNLAPPASHITSSIPEQAVITALQQANLKQCASATFTSALDVPSSSVAEGARKDLVGYAASPADQGYLTPIDAAGDSDSKGIRPLVEGATSENLKDRQRLGRRPVKVILDTVQHGAVSPSLRARDDYLQHQEIGGQENTKYAAPGCGCSGDNTLNKRAQYSSTLANVDVAEGAAGSKLPENLKGRWLGKFRRSNTICITPAQG